jgi:hypothetical protein
MKRPTLSARGIHVAAIAAAAIALGAIASCSFAAGKDAGRLEGPAVERKRQLELLEEGLKMRDRAIRNRETRITQEEQDLELGRQAVAAAAVKYSSARARVVIVDSAHATVDGILERIPPPVLQLVTIGEQRHRADSLQLVRLEIHQVSLEAWGNLWKAQAEDYKRKGELLEQQLADERHGRRWQRIRDVARAAGAGAAIGATAAAVLR